MKTTFHADLLVPLERGDTPLHTQLKRHLRSAVRSGRLRAGAAVPPTRSLARDLGVSRGVVVEAYEQLTAEGYFVARGGSGTRVGRVRTDSAEQAPAVDTAAPLRFDFRPGVPDLSAFPRMAWLASLQRAGRDAPVAAFGYPAPGGPVSARRAIADYLARSRATVGRDDRIVMCGGFTQALDLIARLLQARGVKRVALENPGFGALSKVFQRVGIASVLVPVDERGLMVDRLSRSGATAAVVTPAHHFPSGYGMAPERRVALLDWATREDALLVEDDYDAELRFDRAPLGALQGLAPDRVLYVGTASKTLCPALRLGWLLAPMPLVPQLIEIKRGCDGGAPTLEQLALGIFVERGHLDRHVRTMRALYRLRYELMTAALRRHLPGLRFSGIAGGLHMLLHLPGGADEQAIIARARARALRVVGARQYWAGTRTPPPALVLGYGLLNEANIEQAVRELSQVIPTRAAHRPRRGLASASAALAR